MEDELLERFRRVLAGDKTVDNYFDEDDLLDIFDFAGDQGDDYLRAEALMWGARYFPDSERLKERRAVLYADILGDQAVKAFTADNNESKTLLTRIVAARADIRDKDKAREAIDKLVKSTDTLEDEEIIQLVNYAGETSNLDYIISNLDPIKKKVQYKPALLYELAAEAIEAHMYKEAIPVLDDLVTEMPYNEEYWSLMATSQMRVGDIDGALQSVDMALAIKPDSPTAVVTKGLLLQARGDVEGLTALHNQFPDNAALTFTYIEAVWPRVSTDAELREQVIKLIRNVLTLDPVNQSMLTALMVLTDVPYSVVEQFWKDTHDQFMQAISWIDWAQQLLLHGRFKAAENILRVYEKYMAPLDGEGNEESSKYVACALNVFFRLGKYVDVVGTFVQARHMELAVSPTGYLLCALSLVYLHATDQAVQLMDNFEEDITALTGATDFIEDPNPLFDVTYTLNARAVIDQFQVLRQLLRDPDFDPSKYNPFPV